MDRSPHLPQIICERLKAQLTVRGCLTNQRVAAEQAESWQARTCPSCDTGRGVARMMEAGETMESAKKERRCVRHPERPVHKNSNFCLDCLRQNMKTAKMQRIKKIGLEGIFSLVEGLQEKLEQAARENLRTLQAEMAWRLKNSFEGEKGSNNGKN